MKCAIIVSSLVTKYGRLDAGFYLGMARKAEERLHKAEDQLELAARRVATAAKDYADEKKRIGEMIRDGEVVPIEGFGIAAK